MEPFEFLDHTADLKVKVTGKTLNELFENSVLALCQYCSGGERISSKTWKTISVSGDDNESLLYNFLDELLYLIDAENFIPVKASITLRGYNLKAELYGDSTNNYQLEHIKAATYSEMSIQKVKSEKEEHWEAVFVLDV